MFVMCFFFCKQKTAYVVRISGWGSDGCSSDLLVDAGSRRFDMPAFEGSGMTLAGWARHLTGKPSMAVGGIGLNIWLQDTLKDRGETLAINNLDDEIGRASCGERVCQYV